MTRFPRLRQGRARRGYSLIEALVVISISAVVTSGSLVCISTMLRGERLTALAVQDCQVVARLQRTWNDDVHRAQEWNIGSVEQNSGVHCELSLKDGRKVQYRSSNRGILRQVQTTGQTKEHDVFQFSEGTRFEFHQVEDPRLARLKVIRPAIDPSAIVAASSDSSPNVLGKVVMTFDAALGREARLLEYLQTPSEVK